MAEKRNPVIKCNKCHRLMGRAEPKWKKAGDIEYYYLQCPYCKTLYVISAADAALRQDIKRFKELTAKPQGRQPTKKEIQEARELLQANVARNREIKAQYPLEIKL
ncbi:MAG: hypothetical protein OSJ45_03935 [Lachnospiraceae bacterium]|nr:hypothetical protein [Lachnospiraceae bacterium]